MVMMSDTAMMSNERKIWEAAMLLVAQHGVAAAEVAHREARRRHSADEELTRFVWCWIARLTTELLRSTPAEHERVH
jgi:hypothetical protein